MNVRNKMLLIKISIPVLIIGGGFGVDKLFRTQAEDLSSKPIIVAEDSSALPAVDEKPLEIINKKAYGNVEGFSENLGFIGEDEALVGIGMTIEEFYKKYPDKIDSKDNKKIDDAYNNQYGNMYRLKLSTLEKKPLNIKTRSLLSDIVLNADKVSYSADNKVFIYDFKENTNKELIDTSKEQNASMADHTGNWSKDGKCLISYENGDLKVYNAKDNSTKTLKVKSSSLWISIIPSFYSEDGEDIYFIGVQPKGNELRYQRQGIFKINSSSGKIDEVLVLPYRDTSNSNYKDYSGIPSGDYTVLDGGKRILLNATINGVDGGYIYDLDNKKFYNVIQHTVKSKEGSYGTPMWVSPDKTKVIYMNRTVENNKEQWNLYAAKINGNNLTNRISLYKDINFSGSLNTCVQWSSDSKKILFFTYGKLIEKNQFVFSDKNEVNIITFK